MKSVPRRRNLAVLMVLPGLLSGCGLLSGAKPAASPSAQAGPSGPSWLVSATGSATPSPGPSRFPTSPVPTISGGFLPLGPPVPTRTPGPVCSANSFNFSRLSGLTVAPASTTAKLSWYNVGGANLKEFRLYAISQNLVVGTQRDVGFVTVKPAGPCGQMSGTVTNLSPKTTYVFSVDAVVLRRSGDGTHAATIARSQPVPTR